MVSIGAKVDYGVQVLCVLATSGRSMTARELSTNQNLPCKFLESILNDMRKGGPGIVELPTESRCLRHLLVVGGMV